MSETVEIVNGVHPYGREEDWVKPDDPTVCQYLEEFQDMKLGIFFHFGLYSQIGIVESWSLSDEDASWSQVDLTWDDPKECQRQYTRLNRSFNPIRMVPEEWAKAAKECGFKYMVLTTKHHDGFCLWDTAQTDYKTTSPDCPFSEHKYADIVRHIFDAFRKEGIAISAYFSKADWHSPYYWRPETRWTKPTDRHANYNTEEHPEIWKKFVDFTHAQVMELVSDYGPIHALWFDAGWVCPTENEDIRMDELVSKLRKIQPGILVADRTVGGANENFLTPECTIPEKQMSIPWESGIFLDDVAGWGHRYEHGYKSIREVIHTVVDVISKGGNLAFAVGPQPDGRLPVEGMKILKQMGKWLEVNGEAIYGTRICAPYFQDDWHFTQKPDAVYAIRNIHEKESMQDIEWIIPLKYPAGRIELLGQENPVGFTVTQRGIQLDMGKSMFDGVLPEAVAFKLTK
ncbi:MAG TPA: alpha-L-fucosidase [Candidatus Eubacterium avistercoris]|uniref:alpha-L-fucosidase n=1 Tax=Candidatus Eubacterium avistercoris TaxID=2838567 RepID=A0A9D2D1P0_9FIRM|nr:alpha-L-fucosidase [Candidatus Eubacterium avistercoris]